MSKKMSLRKFFKRCFPPCCGYPFILFFNHYTDEYEIVSRSGDVLFKVNKIKSLSDDDNLLLARELVVLLRECCFCGLPETPFEDVCIEDCHNLNYH